jgi:predicted P-loop ATPase
MSTESNFGIIPTFDSDWDDEPQNDNPVGKAKEKPSFVFDNRGNIVFCDHNVFEVLTKDDEWEGVFAFDEFSQKKMVMKKIPGTRGNPNMFKPRQLRDQDYLETLRWMNRNMWVRASKNVVCDAVDSSCHYNSFSPVKNWLEDCAKLDGVGNYAESLIYTWAERMLGVKPENDDQAVYVSQVGICWLISAVARVFDPGCKADGVLILEGNQGIGKSTALRLLCGAEWFGDALPHIGSKDASDYLRGKWIIELAELSNVSKAEVEVVKAFISRNEECYRPAYGRSEVVFPRQCIFAGTTNKADYLRDETGNRRFWPLKCQRIDRNTIKKERELLWGAAVKLYRDGVEWWLGDSVEAIAKVEQANRLSIDEWTGPVTEYCANETHVSTIDVAKHLGLEVKDINRMVSNRIISILTTIGFERMGVFSNGERRGRAKFFRPNTQKAMKLDDEVF